MRTIDNEESMRERVRGYVCMYVYLCEIARANVCARKRVVNAIEVEDDNSET